MTKYYQNDCGRNSKIPLAHQMPSVPFQKPPGRRATFHFIAGGTAGFLELVAFHPLNVIKNRMQLQGDKPFHGEITYHGSLDAIAKMYRYEGLSAFFKGIVPPICVETPKRGFKFLAYEAITPHLKFGSPTPTPLTYAMTGALVGGLESILTNPFEVVKIMQQAHREKHLDSMTVVKYTIRKQGFGFKGLYRGFNALVARNAIFNFGYFGIYNSATHSGTIPEDPIEKFLFKCFLGMFASGVGSFLSLPLDLAKSRIQGPQPVKGEIKYRTTVQTLRTTIREEGVRALFKGLAPSLARAVPGGALLIVAYEYIYDILIESFAE
ncbi:mitochondrial 2-oxodicarboxylate carrier [Drosophila bipectinata]|uniref:mitochondrial 2-oxodicarboxylate carrier n=1 Tax=Drosophila bipectinata TaxID=42026 RepID=UPI001C8A975D|nr:mitochondrial 2-oxodicarboxylate carrier [Drosophila bipectinata]